MPAIAVNQPFPIFTDADGQPLDDAYIYIGTANQNPVSNPIAVYWDSALTIAAAQPIRTSGGYPVYNGTPARFYTNSDYSILVRDKNGAFIYTSASETDFISSEFVTFVQSGTGAVNRTVQAKLRETVSVKDFGAVGDGVTDDTAAIQAAVSSCQSNSHMSLNFPLGIYKITSTITLGGGGTRGVAFVGETATPQQGSDRPAVTFRWHGGASSMFDVRSTFFQFYNIAFENFTTATDFFLLTTAQWMVFDNCSFVVGSGAARLSRSAMTTIGNQFGYSVVRNCMIENPAPIFLNIDGQATPNGITPVLFENNLVESDATGAFTLVYIKDETIDLLTFKGNTFNGQSNAQLTIVDTTDTPASNTIFSLNFFDNEIDLVANTATDRCFRLTNVPNINFWGNQIQGGGQITAVAQLVNSKVTQFSGNYASSINGTFFACDANSRVFSGVNFFNTTNTAGISTNPGSGRGGGILQTVNTTLSTSTTVTTSYSDYLTASITPSHVSSKILIFINVNGLNVSAATTSIQLAVGKSGSNLVIFETDAANSGNVTTGLNIGGSGVVYMDAPASTNSITYSIRAKKVGAGTATICAANAIASITLMEIAV